MAIPDYQTLMLPVLRLADAAEQIADDLGISPDEREEMRQRWTPFFGQVSKL